MGWLLLVARCFGCPYPKSPLTNKPRRAIRPAGLCCAAQDQGPNSAFCFCGAWKQQDSHAMLLMGTRISYDCILGAQTAEQRC